MSREQELIENLDERLKEIKGICTFTLPASDLELIRSALLASQAEGRYQTLRTIPEFECDFNLAADPEAGQGLDELQLKIEQGDERIISDIELLQELSYGIRHGSIKIIRQTGGGGQD